MTSVGDMSDIKAECEGIKQKSSAESVSKVKDAEEEGSNFSGVSYAERITL